MLEHVNILNDYTACACIILFHVHASYLTQVTGMQVEKGTNGTDVRLIGPKSKKEKVSSFSKILNEMIQHLLFEHYIPVNNLGLLEACSIQVSTQYEHVKSKSV